MEFSILMPVYKAEALLRETVDSVLAQSFEDWELVMAEDGSPDGSGALADRLAAEHPERIRALHFPHRGTIPTRRSAIAAAKGDFILWLDSDDLLTPDCLQTLHDARLRFGDPDLLLYEYTAFFPDGRPEDHRPPLFEDGTLFEGEEGKRPLYELLIRGSLLDSLCIKAFRRELLQEDPTDYAPYAGLLYGEDVLHSLWGTTRARRAVYLSRSLYRYRIHGASVMHDFNPALLDTRFNPLKFRFFGPFMEQWGLADPEHRALLKASSYKTVLEGILYFLEEKGYDRKAVLAYSDDFVDRHPELKSVSRSRALGLKNKVLLGLFAHKKVLWIRFLNRIRRKMKK